MMNARTITRMACVGLATMAMGCGGLTSPGGSSFLIPEEKEIEIGAQVHQEIIAETPLYQDDVIDAYVRSLGKQIVAVSLRPALEHRFFVLDTEMINAFAAPGGFVYVTVGLLRNLRSRSELAGVMGHEVGHVSGFHGVREMEDAVIADLLTQWLLGDDQATTEVVQWTYGFYKSTAHSRDLELEADKLGLQFSLDAGYNPWGLVDFFEELKALIGEGDPISDFLSSHPSPTERIEQSTEILEGSNITPNQSGLVIDDGDSPFITWEQLQARLPAPPAETR